MKTFVGGDYPNCTTGRQLKAGIIDSKTGFEIDTNYESVDEQRVFASGTSAAAFTKNAYFAPGATLGLGLTTGYRIAQIIPHRLEAFKQSQKGDEDGIQHRTCRAPYWFIAGAWTAILGIIAHRSSHKPIKFLHYILMPTAVVFISGGVFVARECTRDYVKKYDNNGNYHYYAGYALLIALWIQVLLGSGIKIYRRLYPNQNIAPNYIGQLHRTNGWLLILLISAQYLTVLYPRSRYVMQYYDHSHSSLAAPGIVFTAIVGICVVYVILKTTNQKNTGGDLNDKLLTDKGRWL